MGDKISKDFSVVSEYRALPGMPYIGDLDFKVDLEKECFMSVNIIRNNPRKFIPHFEHVMSLKGAYTGKTGSKFIKELEKMDPKTSLPPLAIDNNVMNACRLNNEFLKDITDSKQIPINGNQK